MRVTHRSIPACAVAPVALALLSLAAARPVAAQTVLTGHHDSNTGDGYKASGTYLVPADTTSGPSATFNGNGGHGLYTYNYSTVTVTGGQFDSNTTDGFRADNHCNVVISGGQFANNGGEGFSTNYSSIASVTGGQFINNVSTGLTAGSATVTVTGGQFSGNGFDFAAISNGTLDIYGQFAGLSVGQTLTLPQTPVGSHGSFTGTLENDATPAQTFTFQNFGVITLHDVALAAPEPSQTAALDLGVLGLGLLAFKARRRKAVA